MESKYNSTIKLGEFAEVLGGYAFKSSMFSDRGIPVLKIKNVVQKFVDLTEMQCIDDSFYDEKLKKYVVNDKDILIAMTGQGSVGRVGRVYLNENRLILLNQRVGKIITDESKLDSNYLFYILSSERYREILFNSGLGSGQPNLSPTVIKSIEIPYVKIEKQRYIGRLLSLLDEKILINNEMISNLKQLSETLFTHWFINFEFPNEEGLPYKSSGGKMVESELGDIPKCWQVVSIDDITKIVSKGTTPRKKDLEEGKDDSNIMFLKVRDITEFGEIDFSSLEKIPLSIHDNQLKRSKLYEKDLLVSIAGTIGRISYIPSRIGEINTNQAVAFIRLKNIELFNFMYVLIKGEDFREYLSKNIVQAVQANVSLTTLKNYKFALPDKDLLNKWNETISAALNEVEELRFENSKLFELRDTLLPKLLSGEIEIKNESLVDLCV